MDVACFGEFDEGRAGHEAFDTEGGEGDEVIFVILVYVEEGVAALFDVDGVGERGFGGVVAL